MEIFALSGPSGTGKSTSALSFAYKSKIPAIIDDGLLILNGQKIAGTSAKFEKNAISAVKRATFFDEQHKKEVQQAIRNHFISRILIIGTSDKMVKQIASRLEIGEIKLFNHIEDIRSSSQIKIAQYIRKTEGTHVIPLPYKQVEQNFFKRMIQKGVEIFSTKKERIGETTIVHPDFHKGSIKIYKKVFQEMVEFICLNHEQIVKCESVVMNLQQLPTLTIKVNIKYPICGSLYEKIEILQEDIYSHFLRNLQIELHSIYIMINKAS
ncbi:ATP-binding protein [Cytobacillus dafuensis]|uniref:ATP-binding protein n=1 Tax=Cytobacillus dafuensis TaxID=1742359 RepID=A0A5B8ZBV6_CYTDA|nr:ATP-binding protein [Cytobacillus dafuensis]QED48986.1 ATP-binding protein [Cytobacillus dafuensis]